MADLKISQLTGATTPLAGTEVVPLVQSGSTKKVAVSDLTAGRAVTVGSVAVGTTQIVTQGGMWYQTSGGKLVFTPPSSGGFKWNNSSNTVEIASLSDGGALTTADNIVQGTAAKGYNFTANTPAAGMTSQLLNWYEEGTFDPRLSFASGGDTFTYNARIATYTRIGRLVTINLLVDTSAKGVGTGNFFLTNLPFAAAGYASTVPRTVGIANTGPISAYTFSGQSQLYFFTVNTTGVETQITDTSVGAAVTIAMTLSYITA